MSQTTSSDRAGLPSPPDGPTVTKQGRPPFLAPTEDPRLDGTWFFLPELLTPFLKNQWRGHDSHAGPLGFWLLIPLCLGGGDRGKGLFGMPSRLRG